MRELSVHGTLRKRYTGWSIEGGARYALLKSAEMKALVTAIGDVHINADPNFIDFRPQIAAGKRFDLPGGYWILQRIIDKGCLDVEFADIGHIESIAHLYRMAPCQLRERRRASTLNQLDPTNIDKQLRAGTVMLDPDSAQNVFLGHKVDPPRMGKTDGLRYYNDGDAWLFLWQAADIVQWIHFGAETYLHNKTTNVKLIR